jgi:hypothetical protein
MNYIQQIKLSIQTPCLVTNMGNIYHALVTSDLLGQKSSMDIPCESNDYSAITIQSSTVNGARQCLPCYAGQTTPAFPQ